MSPTWRSTEFASTAFVQLTGAVALFMDKIGGETYVALSSLALGIYSVARTIQKRQPPAEPT